VLVGYLNLPLAELTGGKSAPQNALLAAGAARLYLDIDAGSRAAPQLKMALADLQQGDVLIGLSVQTLARTVDGLLKVHAEVEARGASLRVLEMPGGLTLDTACAEGRAILGALALMSGLQAQETGAARAASNEPTAPARSRGRPATAGSQAGEVARLFAQGLRAVDIAATLGIGRASVYRILSQGVADPAPAPTRASGSRSMAIAAVSSGRFDPFSGR
jgi:DNA invertase Pin-like site-specific DNA recombinase